jgi:CheY-like chemotaxis protein
MNSSCNPSSRNRSLGEKPNRSAHSAALEHVIKVEAAPAHAVPTEPAVVMSVLCVPKRPDAPVAAGDRSGLAGLRILVVDDEAGIRRAMRRMLGRRHRVETAGNGREALDRLVSGGRFDVILCDLMMPEMTGIQLYEALATEAPGTTRRIVFMTGGIFSEDARAFLDRVSNPLLEKPLSWERLRLAFHVVLERAGRLGEPAGCAD